jgi:hypothetical protein
MKPPGRQRLPLAPLLDLYVRPGLRSPAELMQLQGLGSRFTAVFSASARFLDPGILLGIRDDDLRDALLRFYDAVVDPPLHTDTLRRRCGFVRHGLAHLLHGRDPLPHRLESCVSPAGAYFVPGLGPSFWSALLQGIAPSRHPAWTPATRAGLERLVALPAGASPAGFYSALLDLHARARALHPELTSLHLDHFLTRVADLRGRNLWADPPPCAFASAVAQARGHTPLRQLLKDRGEALAATRRHVEVVLAARDGKRLGDALAVADPAGERRCPLDWAAHGETLTLWIGRLWEAVDPYEILADFWRADPLPAAGLWLPAAVLHLRDPHRYQSWNEDARCAYGRLDDAADAGAPAERYHLYNEGLAALRTRHALHPLEIPAVLAALPAPYSPHEDPFTFRGAPSALLSEQPLNGTMFGGFCPDTFRFLTELAANNRPDWMRARLSRYNFAVREPLAELCRALASRYVGPVLHGRHGWDLDTQARGGRALTRVCKNAFGRPRPYNTTLWIAFSSPGKRRADAQLFVRLDPTGLRYGLRLGRAARGPLARLRGNVERHAELLYRALRDGGALAACAFGRADAPETLRTITSEADLRAWAAGRTLEASRTLSADDPLLGGDDLVGEILLTCERLLPAFACAAEEDAGPLLARRLGAPSAADGFTDADFRRATFLGADWLRRARTLLGLKRQLILQGVPGTGKTHVARHLARLLTGGRDEAVRLVQFHPSYSYEEFVEGIKVKSVEVEGRHDVTYPVEDGLLCAFAAEAAARPAQTHVLLIDEINRGNLPRIFGELLFLLEYRGQSVGLPYSRRGFRLPDNLYLLATMNAADRSVAMLDQALRRRFSFLEMPPDVAVLAAWFDAHPPAAGPAFAGRVLTLFERLNARLRSDLGAQAQVGHSYFMVPGLDEARLRIVWQHHVRPLLEEQFVSQPGRTAAYELDRLLDPDLRGARRRRVAAAPG